MIFLAALVIPLILIFSPLCEKLGITGKIVTFIIAAPITLIAAAAIQVAASTPEQLKAADQEVRERDRKEQEAGWQKEADDEAKKKFYNATKQYR